MGKKPEKLWMFFLYPLYPLLIFVAVVGFIALVVSVPAFMINYLFNGSSVILKIIFTVVFVILIGAFGRQIARED